MHLGGVLMSWLEDSRYIINNGLQPCTIALLRGVKQGCTPILFATYMALICERFDDALGKGWSAKHVTIYADDFHLSFIFQSFTQLRTQLRAVHVILRILTDMGMHRSHHKAAAIFICRGTLSTKARSQRQGTPFLEVGTGKDAICIPLVQQALYNSRMATSNMPH